MIVLPKIWLQLNHLRRTSHKTDTTLRRTLIDYPKKSSIFDIEITSKDGHFKISVKSKVID